MTTAFDEWQVLLRYRASSRTLGVLALAVLVNGAAVQVFGAWAGPFRQALILLLLTGIVLGLQLGWSGADAPISGTLERSDKAVVLCAAVIGVGTAVEVLAGRYVAIPEVMQWLELAVMLLAPTIGIRARRWRDRHARSVQDDQ